MNSDIIVAQHPIIQNDVKIILYAYTQSIFSGRRIEKLLHDSIRMMWLAQIKHLLIKLLIVLE